MPIKTLAIAVKDLKQFARNLPALALLRLPANALPAIDGTFFYVFCVVQGVLALLLTAFVGPSLISPDLANGGLALYLSRPFSRAEYVAGKMMVLLVLLSLVSGGVLSAGLALNTPALLVLGAALAPLIASVDHWVAFGLLAFVGGRMIHAARRDDEGCRRARHFPMVGC